MNHQDIADRLKALAGEQLAAWQARDARIEKERESLREMCAGIGHIYKDTDSFRMLGYAADARWCCVCGAREA